MQLSQLTRAVLAGVDHALGVRALCRDGCGSGAATRAASRRAIEPGVGSADLLDEHVGIIGNYVGEVERIE